MEMLGVDPLDFDDFDVPELERDEWKEFPAAAAAAGFNIASFCACESKNECKNLEIL